MNRFGPFAIALIFAVALTSVAKAEPRTITDAAGRKVEITDTSRIVSIGGSITEILYALGLQDRVIAVDLTSTFPNDARSKTNIGYMRTLAPEGVLKVAPSLILALEESGPRDAIEILEHASVPFVLVPEAKDAEGVAKKIRFVADAVGAHDEGEKLARAVLDDFSSLSKSLAAVKTRRKAAFVLAMGRGTPIVGGTGTPADTLLQLAHIDNAMAAASGFKPASDEALIAAQPDAVIVMNDRDHTISADTVFAMPAFANTPAAKTRTLLALPGLYLLGFGPRAAHAARDIAAAVYPDAHIAELPARPWMDAGAAAK